MCMEAGGPPRWAVCLDWRGKGNTKTPLHARDMSQAEEEKGKGRWKERKRGMEGENRKERGGRRRKETQDVIEEETFGG